MKILFVTATPLEYSSSANMRNLALIKGLNSNGHSVATFSTSPVKSSSFYDDTLLKDVILTERYFTELSNVHSSVIMKKENSKFKKKIISIMYDIYTKINMYDSRSKLAANVPKNLLNEKFDIIISSSDPKSSHLFAENLIKEAPSNFKKWIQYWGDPFSTDINSNYILSKRNIIKEEKRLLEKSDVTYFVSLLTAEEMKVKYPEIKTIRFLPVPYINEHLTSKTSNKIVVSYMGDYYKSDRNIWPMYEAAKKTGVYWNIIGNSDVEFLEESQKINIKERVSKKDIEIVQNDTDILVCLLNKSGTQIPGKIYHYSATNKPILIILDGEHSDKIKKYFSQFDRYYFCQNTSSDIENELLKIRKDISNGKKWAPNCEFKGSVIAKHFISGAC